MIDLKDCTIQERTATLTTYNFAGTTPRGETVAVDFTAIHPDNSYKNSLPNLWRRHGFISYVLPSYWSVDVYVYDERGCWGRYNPTEKTIEETTAWQRWSGQRHVSTTHKHILDFDWMLPATSENRDKLLAEIIRRANKED